MSEISRVLGGVLGAILFLVPGQAVSVAAAASTSPTAAPKIEKRDMLLMSLSLNDRLIIVRTAPDGSCRQYLRQGGGFSSVLPVSNKGSDFAATASPDGKWLAFYSSRSGAVNLWISDSSGLNQRQLTDSEISIAEFNPLAEPPVQFSPDSRHIAFLSSGDIWITGTEGENPRTLTSRQGVTAFAWEPAGKPDPGAKQDKSGRSLAYIRHGSLRMVHLSGHPDDVLATDAANYPTLSFNPNAKSRELFYFYNGVWKINTLNKKKERLAGSFSFPNRVRSDPQGANIAYVGFSSDVREEIFTLSPGKKGQTQVTLGGASQPFFSKDGKTIYFRRQGGLWRIGLQGEKATPVYDAQVYMAQPVELELLSSGACP